MSKQKVEEILGVNKIYYRNAKMSGQSNDVVLKDNTELHTETLENKEETVELEPEKETELHKEVAKKDKKK